jgi:hypothetical protein
MPVQHNKKSIRDLINEYSHKNDKGAHEILQALEYTKIFLLQTSLQFQASREKVITPTDIVKILDSAANQLAALEKIKTSDVRAVEVLVFCKKAIEDQLRMLNEFNDKIFKYYESQDNSLKRILKTPSNRSDPSAGG